MILVGRYSIKLYLSNSVLTFQTLVLDTEKCRKFCFGSAEKSMYCTCPVNKPLIIPLKTFTCDSTTKDKQTKIILLTFSLKTELKY